MHVMLMADQGRDAATTLAVRSLHDHHPEAVVTVVVTDPTSRAVAPDGATALAARDLEVGSVRYIDAWLIGGRAIARWSVVPAAVRALGAEAMANGVLVLPGSAWVRAGLSDLLAAAPSGGIALLPRGTDPAAGIAFGGWVPDTVAFGPGADAALDWWEGTAERILLADRDPSTTPPADPWAWFVTGGVAVTAVTDPSLRLSPASADRVPLEDDGTIRLAQFPGFDPQRPWWFAESADVEPLLLASESEALRRLCLAYAAALGPTAADARPSGGIVGLDHSGEFCAVVGAGFRSAHTGGRPFPNPLDPDTAAAFFDWMRDPSASTLTGVSPAADIVWLRRPDIAAAFPNVRWSDRDGFVRWLWTHGLNEGLITTATLPPRTVEDTTSAEDAPGTRAPARLVTADHPERLPFGVNLVGYHDAELGLGVAVRRVGAALDAAGISWTRVTYDRSHSRRRGTSANRADAPYWFNLVLVAPDQLAYFADDVGSAFFEGHHNIGLWFWETDAMNRRQIEAFDLVDEVWGSTRYLADVFAAHTAKPVAHVPVPLEFAPATADPAIRARLGLDERFTFLFSFDFLSIAERKNPLGLVEAYRRAFEPAEGCRLVLKSINGDRHVAEAEELRSAIADRPDIELWDRYLDGPDRIDLVANVDCYVSLHRSEGLGLTMAEAMSCGTPVIATGYSGNLDFMPEGSALLVDHDVVDIGPGSFYPATGHWAEPDLDHAAALLRTVRDDAEVRFELRRRGPLALEPFTVRRVGATIDARLREVWR